MQDEELRPAIAALERARRALQVCRDRPPAPDSGAASRAALAKTGALAES